MKKFFRYIILIVVLTVFVNSDIHAIYSGIYTRFDNSEFVSDNSEVEIENPIKQYYRGIELNDNINIVNAENRLSANSLSLNYHFASPNKQARIQNSWSCLILSDKVPIFIKGHSLRH